MQLRVFRVWPFPCLIWLTYVKVDYIHMWRVKPDFRFVNGCYDVMPSLMQIRALESKGSSHAMRDKSISIASNGRQEEMVRAVEGGGLWRNMSEGLLTFIRFWKLRGLNWIHSKKSPVWCVGGVRKGPIWCLTSVIPHTPALWPQCTAAQPYLNWRPHEFRNKIKKTK